VTSGTEGAVCSSAAESCSATSLAVSHGTAMIASTVSGEAGPRLDTDGELARIQHASSETDFHFFSDTEATPGCGCVELDTFIMQ
jgi:hypothetical protein